MGRRGLPGSGQAGRDGPDPVGGGVRPPRADDGGVPGPGGLADLVARGEGRAGGGKGLREQDRGLLKCRITAIYQAFE